MGIKIHTSLVIYLLLHNGHKYVLSQPNLTESSIKPPNSSESEHNSNNNSKTKVELDIKSKKTTDQWTYTKDANNNKLHTYEAKEGFAFNKVKNGSKDIWSTTDSKEYASKVEFDENNKTVTLTLLNGSTKKFKESGRLGSKSWSEITQSQQPSGTPVTPSAEGTTYGGSDPSGGRSTNPSGRRGSTSSVTTSGERGSEDGSRSGTPSVNPSGGSGDGGSQPKSNGTDPSGTPGTQQPGSGTTGTLGSTDGSGTGGRGSDREQAKQVKTEPQKKKESGPPDVEDEVKFNELVEAFKKDLNSDGKLKDSLGNDQSDSKNKIKALIKAENHVDVEVKVEGNDIGNNVHVNVTKTGGGDTGIQDKSNSRIKKGGQYVNVIFEVKVDEDKNSKIAKRLREALMKAVGRDMTKTGTNSSCGDGTQGSTPTSPANPSSGSTPPAASNPAKPAAVSVGTRAAAANPTSGNGGGTQGTGGGNGSQQPSSGRDPGGTTPSKPASAGTTPPSPPSGSQGGRGGGK